MGELVHRCGRMIMVKMWWVNWGPQVVGSWGQVEWLGKGVVEVGV